MHIRKVLVTVDFSPPSALAVNYAVGFARKFRATLSLLHVVESPSSVLHAFPGEAERIQNQRKRQAEKMLPVLISPEANADLRVRFMVRTGEIEEVIESVVREEQTDVVVMGTHGRSLFGRLLLGSVTQALLRNLGVPVLTVCRVSRPLEFGRILFATDFGLNSDKGFQFALDIASTTGCSLVVVHALEEKAQLRYATTPEGRELFEKERLRATKHDNERFAELRSAATRRNVPIECILAEGEAWQCIVRIADQNAIDLIILGLRRKRVMERTLLGSTAEPLIRTAHAPVLSIPIDIKAGAKERTANS